jgi:hypothetical protein
MILLNRSHLVPEYFTKTSLKGISSKGLRRAIKSYSISVKPTQNLRFRNDLLGLFLAVVQISPH